MTPYPLGGTWRLVSLHFVGEDGQVAYLRGADPSGLTGWITYADEGRVSVAMMKTVRPGQSTDDYYGGTVEEKAAAYDTSHAHSGTYDLRDDTVVRTVEVCPFQNWVGTKLTLHLEVEGDRLSLRTSPMPLYGAIQVGYLVWQRIVPQ